MSLSLLVQTATAAQVEARLQGFLWSTQVAAAVDDRFTKLVLRRRVTAFAFGTPEGLDGVFQDVLADLGPLGEAVEAIAIEATSHRPRWWSATYLDSAGEMSTAPGPVQRTPYGPVAVYHRCLTHETSAWRDEFLGSRGRSTEVARHPASRRSPSGWAARVLLFVVPALVLLGLAATGAMGLVLTGLLFVMLAVLVRTGVACALLVETDVCRGAKVRALRTAARRVDIVQWARAAWTGMPSRSDPPAMTAKLETSRAMAVQRALPGAVVATLTAYALIVLWPWLTSNRSQAASVSSTPAPDPTDLLYVTLIVLGVFAMAWLVVSAVDRRFPTVARRALGRATAGLGLVAFLGSLRWWVFAIGAGVPVFEVDTPHLGVVSGGTALLAVLAVLMGLGAYLVAYMPSGIGRAASVLVVASGLLLVSASIGEADYLAGWRTRYGVDSSPRLMPGGACWALERPLQLPGHPVVPKVLKVAEQSGLAWVRYPSDGRWELGNDPWLLARVSLSSVTGQTSSCPTKGTG